jgi:uncharacterized protein
MWRLPRFWTACAVFWLAAGVASAQPPLWIAHGRHATVYLFGSVHLLPSGLAWRPPELDRALALASDLWFEIPMDAAGDLAANRAALALGLQPPGQTLSAELTADQRAHLARAAKAYGQPVEGLDRLEPWLAEITLAVASYRQDGATPQDGVEHALSDTAPPGVRRRALETPADQIRALASAPLADQVASLDETLSELDEGPAAYDRLVTAWMAGDVKGLVHEVLEPMIDKTPGVYKAVVADRNHRWVSAIRRRLRGGGVAVIVVGVGHLIGPDSVPALLRAQGIEVEGPGDR